MFQKIIRSVPLDRLHITVLRSLQKVTVFSPNGEYLAVAGSSEVCSLTHAFHFPNKHFTSAVLVNST